MKKLIFILFSFCIVLSGCVGFVPNESASKQSFPTAKNRAFKRASPPQGQIAKTTTTSTSIALTDFTDLSLNNYQPTQGNLWDEIGSGLTIESQENRPEVQAQIRWFINHPAYLARTTERARPYMYIVYQEVQSRHLPTELVLLPINESAYYPFSYSSTGATGIWQLMPGTASDFGLKRNAWYDGRRDIFDSTNAALDYLTYLAHYFNGDWLLAIAAYDTGEGNVERAIARNARAGLPTDFWSLHLAAETRAYVPRLMALAAIIAHPERYPVALPPIDAKPVVAPVHINGQIKLTDAARFAGISVNQLKLLNPGLSHTITDPSGDSKLLLPINSIDSFKENLSGGTPSSAGTAPTSPESFSRYRVQYGDTIESIANRFNINADDLRAANSLLGHHVPPGKVLLIPNVVEHYKPATTINLDQANLRLETTNNNFTNRRQLTEMNRRNMPITLTHQPENDSEKVDTRESIPINAAVIKKVASAVPLGDKHIIKHKVMRGETLSSISKRYHISIQQLINLNPGIANRPLKPGVVIIIQTTNKQMRATPATLTKTTKVTQKKIASKQMVANKSKMKKKIQGTN